jgi:lipoyl-dependent peroxiredoxin subunit C
MTIGLKQKFPTFALTATVTNDVHNAFKKIDNDTYSGKWLVVFFWPKDFTFVCPTEIMEFGRLNGEFNKRGAQVLGGSVDSEFVHLAWRQQNKALSTLPFPMLADIKRELCGKLGIIAEDEGVAQRATFIVDPEGLIRHITLNDMNVGRNVEETLRVLDALQTGELCPCAWKKGEETIQV